MHQGKESHPTFYRDAKRKAAYIILKQRLGTTSSKYFKTRREL